MCAQAPLHRQLKNPGLWAPALFPARPLGLTTSKTSQGPALWSKTPHLGSPTAPASAPHPLLPFKSMRMTSKRPKLITDFKSPKFNLPDHCSFKRNKTYNGQTSPPEPGAFENCSFGYGLESMWVQIHQERPAGRLRMTLSCSNHEESLSSDNAPDLLKPSTAPGASGSESACQCRRQGFDPWVGKIPWRRKCQPTPVFLPGESRRQRSLAGFSSWGHKELDMT